MATLDILMITHDRLEYLQKALQGILDQDFQDWHLKIWDNASQTKTTDWLKTIHDDRIDIRFDALNESLAYVTSRVFGESQAEFVGKIDSDTIVPPDWASRLIAAHQVYHFGFIGGFHFRQEDIADIIPRIEVFNGVSLWRKHHIGGCAYMIRREDFKGYKGDKTYGLSEYQEEMGLVNGYLWDPIMFVDHMEHAGSPYLITNDEYREYKKKTHNMTLEHYMHGSINKDYLKENTL
jgi:glycosyltransferase involved in cell wall biosynthesis